ncbi:MAG: DNA polymerase IV [Lachnospiraceae bacterium]|nr:DNA polymerase IV [Lachnospiraceae bacterium]
MGLSRLVFHVDVNSAFLSWSSVDMLKKDPAAEDLRLIPSAVGGDPKTRTGIVLAKSVPARKFGVKTGEPLAQALHKCPQLKVISPDFRIYSRSSAAMMTMLAEYAPVVEKFSIDEAFLDMTGTGRLYPDPVALAHEMKDRIHRELGFTVNIGISSNKLLAKMASDFEKPDKVHTLFPEEIPDKMWNLPVGDLLYVGHHSVEKLRRMDIQTIGQLAHTPESVLKNVFGMKQAHQMHNYANGIDDSPVGEEDVVNKGYGNSITLPCDLVRAQDAYPVLLALADSVGSRLRADGMSASSITVTIKDNTFHTVSHQLTLSQSTDGTDVIYRNAVRLFDQLWDGRTPIRLLGVSAGKAVQEEYYQYTLFDEEARQKARSLDQMVDSIRNRYGSDALKRASLLHAEQTKRIGRKHRKEPQEGEN